MSKALEHCGYEVAADERGGAFRFVLSTPFGGASVRAELEPAGESGREWRFALGVLNNRGSGWTVGGAFADCGRYVAKSMLRTMALEMRRAYCHRGTKAHRRAAARAAAKEGGEE